MLVTLLVFIIPAAAIADSAANKLPSCHPADTLGCLVPLRKIRELFPKLNICILQELGLPRNEERMKQACKLFGDYNSCAAATADSENCKVTAPLDRLVTIAGSLMCDVELHRMVAANKECYDKITNTSEYKDCASNLINVVNWKKLSSLIKNRDSDQHCKLLEGFYNYQACKRPIAARMCGDAMEELLNHAKDKVQRFIDEFGCKIVKKYAGVDEESKTAQPQNEQEQKDAGIHDMLDHYHDHHEHTDKSTHDHDTKHDNHNDDKSSNDEKMSHDNPSEDSLHKSASGEAVTEAQTDVRKSANTIQCGIFAVTATAILSAIFM
jgi:hypothetical protein